jgi:hypothetical protein
MFQQLNSPGFEMRVRLSPSYISHVINWVTDNTTCNEVPWSFPTLQMLVEVVLSEHTSCFDRTSTPTTGGLVGITVTEVGVVVPQFATVDDCVLVTRETLNPDQPLEGCEQSTCTLPPPAGTA